MSISIPVNSAFTKDEIAKFRVETTGTRNVIHLNNAGSGLMPDVVTQAQVDHIHLESQIGGYEAAALNADIIMGFYEQCGILLNTKARNIAFTSSATDAYTRALSSIPFESGDVILTDRDDFVSNQIQFLSLKKRLGVQIVHIANEVNGGVDPGDLKDKLYKHRPKLLSITHIPTNSGLVQPVGEVGKIYHEYLQHDYEKTWYILDACQSAGQMKLDVQNLHCDFMSFSCRKFLRGPRGTGALFISDRALQGGLEPMFIDMRGAEWKEKDRYDQQPDAKRFEDWDFAYSTVLGTKSAIEYCSAIGEEKIWQQVKLLSGITRQRLKEMDRVHTMDRGPELAVLVTFHVEGSDPVYIVQELLRRKINGQ
jgi:selenocysteine lyase/cysteine desulfurase